MRLSRSLNPLAALMRFIGRYQHARDLHRRGFSWQRSIEMAWSWL